MKVKMMKLCENYNFRIEIETVVQLYSSKCSFAVCSVLYPLVFEIKRNFHICRWSFLLEARNGYLKTSCLAEVVRMLMDMHWDCMLLAILIKCFMLRNAYCKVKRLTRYMNNDLFCISQVLYVFLIKY